MPNSDRQRVEKQYGRDSLEGIAKATTRAYFESKVAAEQEQKKAIDREKCERWVEGFEEEFGKSLSEHFEPKILIVGDSQGLELLQKTFKDIPSGALNDAIISTLDVKAIAAKSSLVQEALDNYDAHAQELNRRHDIDLRPAAESAYTSYLIKGV